MRSWVKIFLEFHYKIGITFMLIGVILIYILVLTGVCTISYYVRTHSFAPLCLLCYSVQ